jgi:hypothetical protein
MISNDFIDAVEFDTVEKNNCNEFGCHDEGVCRCSVIEQVFLRKVYLDMVRRKIIRRIYNSGKNQERNKAITQILFGYDSDLVLNYCVDRLLSKFKIWDLDNWSYTTDNGFYGEEVNSVFIKTEIFSEINGHISELEKLDELRDIIFYLLELEYGSILEKLEDKNFKIDYVDFSKLIFGQKSHKKNVELEDLSNYHYPTVKGIVIKQDDNYFVVDGYHRLSASKSGKVLVIIAE